MRTLAAISLLLIGTSSYAADEVLFNGKDLTGWSEEAGPPNAPKTDVWRVKDGAIMCAGAEGGAGARRLSTNKSYTNFVLSFDYKWAEVDPAGRGGYNSGVFFRATSRTDPDRVVWFNYEAQIAVPSGAGGGGTGTGDLWIIGYADPDFKGERTAPSRGPRAGGRVGGQAAAPPPGYTPGRGFPRATFADKPVGEWNTFVIRADGDKLTFTVNGEVVNRATGAGSVPGAIALECGSAPILFRNIKVTPLS